VRIKSLRQRLSHLSFNDDNFHRIALSNLKSPKRRIERWWAKKYRTPAKDFEDHTEEELYIEMLEDFYEKNPKEAKKFWTDMETKMDIGWDGHTSDEYEESMQRRIEELQRPIDISQYQSDKEVDSDVFYEEIDRLFPVTKIDSIGDDIDDNYEVETMG